MSTAFRCFSILAVSAVVPLAAGCGDGERSPSTTTATATTASSTTVPTSYAATTPESVAAASVPASASASASTEFSYADAEHAFHAGRYRDAETLFTTYTERHADNEWGHYMLGLSSWRAGNLARAEEAFNQALALDPRHRKSLFNSARVLLELNRDTEALERVEQALAIEPMSAEGLRLLGRARHELGQTDQAIDAYRRALALDDRDVWSMNNLGLIYIQLGRYADALPPLARVVQLRSTSPVFQNNLAAALERTGHYGASRAAYEAALRADSTYDKARVGLTRVTGLSDTTAVETVDLAAVAEAFAATMKQWRDSGDADEVVVDANEVVVDANEVVARDTMDTLGQDPE